MTEQRDIVPLEEAAQRLGVSADALRKRLERAKTIKGVKIGHHWFVRAEDLPSAPPSPNGHVQTADAAIGERPPDAAPDASAVSSLALQAAVDALSRQLQEKDRQIAELHRIIERLTQHPAALPAPSPPEPEQPAEPPRRRRWWAFWES
jgi:hypothetical protein